MKWLIPLTLFAGLAHAGTEKFDAQMAPVAEQYVKLHAALFGSSDDVAEAAKALVAAAAKVDGKTVTGEHAKHYADLPTKLQTAAKAFAAAPDLAARKAAFKDLSKPLAMWVTMSKPAGYSVGYCSMVKASWVQKGTAVQNPYEPKTMPGCGEIVGGEMPPASQPSSAPTK